MTLEQLYNQESRTPSDINEHLCVLKTAAEKYKHITEFGVRAGSSTIGFLAGKPNKMISYDIIKHPNINVLERIAKNEGIDYSFITADTREINIEKTDILFIDTLHTYKQLKTELMLHHMNVRKYIIMHDTVTFGIKDMDNVYNTKDYNYPFLKNSTGLLAAINEFVNENIQWTIKHTLINNNGLTILYRSVI